MVISRVIDAVLVFCCSLLIINVFTLDIQIFVPSHLLPNFLNDFQSWYIRTFDDYLYVERPNFFIGIVALHSLVHLPLSIANVYGLIATKAWSTTTCLIQGVSGTTFMAAIFWEMAGSQKASRKMLLIYALYTVFCLLAIVRGLYVPVYAKTTATHGPKTSIATKKRA